MSKVRFRIDFRECEHDGDLDNYIYDIKESGGTIINKEIDYDDYYRKLMGIVRL